MRFEPRRPFSIAMRLNGVLTPIHFDNEPRRQAQKIHDVRADGNLPAKPMPVELFPSKTLPQARFRLGRISVQFPGEWRGHG